MDSFRIISDEWTLHYVVNISYNLLRSFLISINEAWWEKATKVPVKNLVAIIQPEIVRKFDNVSLSIMDGML